MRRKPRAKAWKGRGWIDRSEAGPSLYLKDYRDVPEARHGLGLYFPLRSRLAAILFIGHFAAADTYLDVVEAGL